MHFNIKTPDEKILSVKPILFKHLLELARISETNDNNAIKNKFNSVFIAKEANIFNKTYALIKLHSLCIDDVIKLNLNNRDISIDTDLVLNAISNFEHDKFHQEITIKAFKMHLDLPIDFIIDDNIGDLFISVINKIEWGNNLINVNELNDIDKKRLIDNLPADIFTAVSNYIKDQIKNTNVILVPGTTSLNKQPLAINFLSCQPFQFLKTLYSSYTINYCLELLYILSSKLDSLHILNSTHRDIMIYIKLYEEEAKRSQSNPVI